MTLDEFKTEFRSFLKRGTDLDSKLDGYIRRGIRFIEMNYSLFYMEKRIAVTATANNPTLTLTLPVGQTLKALKHIRFSDAAGRILHVNKVDFEAVERLSTYRGAFPSQVWIDGDGTITFNGTPLEALSGYANVTLYSAYPAAGASHWLFDNAEGLVLGAAGLECALDMRNEQLQPFAQMQFERWIKVALQADFEARWIGQDVQQ